MTIARLNGIRLSWTDHGGDGPPAVLVMGTGSPGRVWDVHQVPALRRAGLRVVTVDNRGIPPTDECAAGFTVGDMAADVAALIEHLDAGPAAVVGTSLGSRVVLELALARPDLVGRVAALAAHARLNPVQEAYTAGLVAASEAGVDLPVQLWSAMQATHNLSPSTLDDDRAARDWLDVIGFGGAGVRAGHRAQLRVSLELDDRRDAYRGIGVPVLVVAFADDRAIPVRLSREVADAVPGARYAEIADAGHYGYLERPAEVNRVLVDFLTG
ncbi:Pimeloyl-ACP methyl ester carboxylesterase [Pseudonocardia ammonioxydans]|uniref:Pimeloyl-ACP methyl ester carboxylesterase n=1 Tax=Pseudonocardia ammonioxydans TaxID=260086 RepID=A0A1I5AYT9_PSUAM|nr:alpha/beta fold hydrolase [Pseudonocardia ammonioxydans]SFN67656.1 Pimeloyl-ACP methyl ester carboxylesterase [Pseudonocardia ammonioxydans]